MLVIVLFLYFHFNKNPNLFDPLVGEFSSRRTRLEGLAILLPYIALCYVTGKIPFARFINVAPGFLYRLAVWGLSILASMFSDLLSVRLWAKDVRDDWEGWDEHDAMDILAEALLDRMSGEKVALPPSLVDLWRDIDDHRDVTVRWEI
jgi:hypothetical protein